MPVAVATPTAPPVCVHCGDPSRRISKARGLCRRCYDLPGVRRRYPPVSKFGRRGVGGGVGKVRRLGPPTDALPGSEGKLRVLQERARRGLALWHPLDARTPGDDPGRDRAAAEAVPGLEARRLRARARPFRSHAGA